MSISDQFARRLAEALAQTVVCGAIQAEELAAAELLATTKYGALEWNHRV
jgi:hypothetical protein